MKAVLKEVGKEPRVIEIENTLEAFQKVVGGYIEVLSVGNSILLICNEEGKLNGLEPNFSIGYDVIVGNALFVKEGEDGEFADFEESEKIF